VIDEIEGSRSIEYQLIDDSDSGVEERSLDLGDNVLQILALSNGIQDQEAIAAGEMTDIAKRRDRQLKADEWQGNEIHLQEPIGKGRRASPTYELGTLPVSPLILMH